MTKEHSYWGINLSHDASICQVSSDGEIDWFVEEERYSRVKHNEHPFSIIPNLKFDKEIRPLQISGLYEDWEIKEFENCAKVASTLIKKFYNIKNIQDKKHVTYELFYEHHILHAACGFYNSGFDQSAILVVDGMGNYVNDDYHEVESIYSATYPNKFKKHFVNVTNSYKNNTGNEELYLGIGMIHSALSDYFGFGQLGSGKLMGLSPYGTEDVNIKPFVINGKIDQSQFYRTRYGCKFIPYDYVQYEGDVLDSNHPKHKNLCNLAYRIQKDFESYMLNLILKTLDITGEKNIILTGGCALNCVANYKYLKYLPKDVKLYVEPISTDAGISLGLAKLDYYASTNSMDKHPLKNLYLGLE